MKYRKEILRGFRLLDKKKLGWKVDLRKLHMGRCADCTLGQNYNTFSAGLQSLGIQGNSKIYGFDVEPVGMSLKCDFPTLTKEVKILIKEWRKK